MSCPDCQQPGSRKAPWIMLVAVIAAGAVAAAELGRSGAGEQRSAATRRHG